jgi:hypothetical protein
VSSAADFGAVDEDLSPPPGWLESFPIRFRLANPAAFDYLAMLWGIAQALLPQIKPPYRDTKRRAHAMSSLFYNFLQSLSVVQSTLPEGKGIAWRGTVPPQK